MCRGCLCSEISQTLAGVDVASERDRIRREGQESRQQLEKQLGNEQARQRAQLADKLIQRRKLLAKKQVDQIEREAPEVAALAKQLQQMQGAKEAELEKLAAQHAEQLRVREEQHSAQLQARQEEAERALAVERTVQHTKWEDEERKRKKTRSKMVTKSVELSAETITDEKQHIMMRHQREMQGFEAQIAAERERQAATMRERLANLRQAKQAWGSEER